MEDYHLINEVIKNSVAKDWNNAVREWKVISMNEDTEANGQCVCGKEHIRYLFTIRNVKNGKVLYPIGSSCITKFGNPEMDEQVLEHKVWYEFIKKVCSGQAISKKDLSRRLINLFLNYHLVDHWEYNFMKNVFNKRSVSTNVQDRFNRLLDDVINRILMAHVDSGSNNKQSKIQK